MATSTPTAPIVLTRLNHWFGTGEARKQAIFDASLSVTKGSLTILLMGCLREVEDGSVRLLGTELKGAGHEAQEALRRRLGFIFQGHNLHNSLSARRNVLLGLQVHGRGDPMLQNKAVEHILGLLGLGDHVDYLPEKLSGGQKQRVAIARALVSNPDVVFADEPTAALDHVSGHTVVAMLKKLGQVRGTTTVMVTHDNRILDLADRIVTLEDGRIVRDTAAGDPRPVV